MHRFKHSKRAKIAAWIVAGVLTIWVGTSYALSNISLILGTTTSYDFGGYGPGYAIPATLQIQAFTLKPGEGVPWHYHKAPSYVIVTHGKLTMQQLVGPNQCASHEMPAGSGFVENPGMVHTVANTGNDVAVIWWATVFPKSDPIVEYTPEFKSGGDLSGGYARMRLVDSVVSAVGWALCSQTTRTNAGALRLRHYYWQLARKELARVGQPGLAG